MLTLERIEIEGFKSIRKMALDLRPINILIGANGAGKSNFISVFTLLQRMTEGRLQQHVSQAGGANSLLHHGRKQTEQIRINLSIPSISTYYESTLVPTAKDGLSFAGEHWTDASDNWGVILPSLADGAEPHWAESSLRDVASPSPENITGFSDASGPAPRKAIKQFLHGVRVYHFHDTSPSARIKQTQNLNDNETLRSDASNLASFLYLLRAKHPESYRRIVATIRLAAPYFDDFRLRPNPLNEQKILLEWSERESDDYFNAHALSDGTLRFICLATLLLQPELPAMIIIDEPELGLHPYAIQLLAGMVRSASLKSQIILSTQSVTLVNQFVPEDLVIVDRHDRASTFHRPTAEETASWLESYSLGELWEKNVLGGRPG